MKWVRGPTHVGTKKTLQVCHKDIGRRFGRLEQVGPTFTVRRIIPSRPSGRLIPTAVFLCHGCGEHTTMALTDIKHQNQENCKTCAHYKHGMTGTKLYRTWLNMITRCYDDRCPMYHRYGARGIRVCDRWRDSPENFAADMGDPPTPRHSIDRKDNNGSYTPDNCRWATRKQQNYNTCKNMMLEAFGETMCLAAWADRLNMNYSMLRGRIRRGWSPEEAFTTPIGCRRPSSATTVEEHPQ